MEVIAKSRPETTPIWTRPIGCAVLCACAVLLSGCVGGRFDIASGIKVDRSVRTGSVPGSRTGDTAADEATIRNAVSSIDLAHHDGSPIPWANSATGSAGVISGLVEKRDEAGQLCRDFTTTRHSYRGVSGHDGRACMSRGGEWALVRFDQHG